MPRGAASHARGTRAAQAALARDYGIQNFCYRYWVDGRCLLERPLALTAIGLDRGSGRAVRRTTMLAGFGIAVSCPDIGDQPVLAA